MSHFLKRKHFSASVFSPICKVFFRRFETNHLRQQEMDELKTKIDQEFQVSLMKILNAAGRIKKRIGSEYQSDLALIEDNCHNLLKLINQLQDLTQENLSDECKRPGVLIGNNSQKNNEIKPNMALTEQVYHSECEKNKNNQSKLDHHSRKQTIPFSPSRNGGFIEQLHAFLEENYANNKITIPELASSLCLSVSHLRRKLNIALGVSPQLYLRKFRLQKAHQLIINTDLRISEIALECGFENCTHFSKSFHNEYGQAPSQLREKHTMSDEHTRMSDAAKSFQS